VRIIVFLATVGCGPGVAELEVEPAPTHSDTVANSTPTADTPSSTSPTTSDPTDTHSTPSDTVPLIEPPERILFIGNSFTLGGPIPDLVDMLANDAGWPDPHVDYSAVGGESLEGHRDRDATVDLVDEGDWDVVVLQEYSTRATDNIGDPEQFKTDATWFHDRAVQSSPDVRVVLYETWALHADHSYYPNTFSDPEEMQEQVRYHYNHAAHEFIPDHAAEPLAEVLVSPVGDAWEDHLAEPAPVRLHDDDDYHAGINGQYLNALVLYSSIYERGTTGRTPWTLNPADAERLQATADAATGYTEADGPGGALPVGLESGQRARVDLGSGSDETSDSGWNNLTSSTSGSAGNLVDSDAAATTVDLFVSTAFAGVNQSGIDTTLFPDSATRDSFYCGSFDDHDDGLLHPGAVTLTDLDPTGSYVIELFAARSGDDDGRGRLTRYTVDGQTRDLEVSDNTTDKARFVGVVPEADGSVVVEVAVSPAGTARFCYLGVLEIERE